MELAIIWLLLIVAAFWFLIVRPQRRRMVEMRALQSGLSEGDDVITNAGFYGVVVELDDTTVMLEIAPGTVVKLARGAIVQSMGDDAPSDDDGDSSDDADEAPGPVSD